MDKLDYRKAGVDIEAGENAVNRIKPLVRQTFNENVLTDIGSFGGLYAIQTEQWNAPVLVSSADGVGTKLMVAQMAKRYDTVGQCLINHCVNDIFVQGAKPLFFLDYIGIGKMVPEIAEKIIVGLTAACRENGMALIGGEMAEMPGIYRTDDFDLVGTIVGIVEKDDLITGEKMQEGDVVIGFPSTGLHTNGYSLARKIVFEKMGLAIEDEMPGTGMSVADALLAVHRSYYKVLAKWAKPSMIHGMAHITGGGIPGNLKRVIPDGVAAEIDTGKWEIPALFETLGRNGEIEKSEMFRAFNMGVGYIVVCGKDTADEILAETDGFEIGKIVSTSECEKKVILK